MRMKNPPRPGLSVRYDCLEPLGLSVTEAAKVLGVTRQAMNNLISGKGGISAEMAIRKKQPCGVKSCNHTFDENEKAEVATGKQRNLVAAHGGPAFFVYPPRPFYPSLPRLFRSEQRKGSGVFVWRPMPEIAPRHPQQTPPPPVSFLGAFCIAL